MGYIESPQFWGESAGSHMFASEGGLTKLAHLVGMFHDRMLVEEMHVVLATVNEWKGQLPKSVVECRVKSILGAKACSKFRAHIWDAAGLGLFAFGLW